MGFEDINVLKKNFNKYHYFKEYHITKRAVANIDFYKKIGILNGCNSFSN